MDNANAGRYKWNVIRRLSVSVSILLMVLFNSCSLNAEGLIEDLANPGGSTVNEGVAGAGTVAPGTAGAGVAGAGTVDPGTAGAGVADAGTIDPGTAGAGTFDTEIGIAYIDSSDVTRLDPGEEGSGSRNTDAQAGSTDIAKEVQALLQSMTLEEKVLQMFVISPEALTGVGGVTLAGETTRAAVQNNPVGGLLYMAENLQSVEQITEMLSNTQQYSMERISLPMFLCVDEEGGTVRRINGRGIIPGDEIPSMCYVSSEEDARRYGAQMGSYLSQLGFNVDFAPVADTLTNSGNQVVRERSFGSDPSRVASLAVSVMEGLHEYNVASTFKHFPGHGSTAEDTHQGAGISYQTMDDLLSCDLVPFQAGADNGTDMIMTGHISLPEVTGDNIPASLSYPVVTGILRDIIGYDGLVITDSLAMGAVSQSWDSADAAVMAVKAGNDLLLCPADFSAAYQGVLNAVRGGDISEERIDESVERILKKKMAMMSEKLPDSQMQ